MESKKRFNKMVKPGMRANEEVRVKTLRLLLIMLCLLPAAFAPPASRAAQKSSEQKIPAQKMDAGYVCPMDADVRSAKPGKCPKCGMALEKASAAPASVAQTAPT